MNKNLHIIIFIILLLSLITISAYLDVFNKKSYISSYKQECYDHYKRQQDSLYQKLIQVYGKEKVGSAIYSCISLDNENTNLDSLCMGYIPYKIYINFDDVQTILQHKIKIGFNFLQCYESLGIPQNTNITITEKSRYETWHYDNGYILYLKNWYLVQYSIH